jgi:hypothetical protein
MERVAAFLLAAAALNVGNTEGSLGMSADGAYVEFMLGEAEVPGIAPETFTLRDDAGTLLAEFDQEVGRTADSYQGGWPCGPSCWSAEVPALGIE